MPLRLLRIILGSSSTIVPLSTACALAALCAASSAAAQAACDLAWPEIPDDSESGCPEPGTTLIVHANEYLELSRDCDYRGVDVRIEGGNSWLNCNNSVLRHGDATTARHGIYIEGGETGIANVRVSHCFVDGYDNGLRVASAAHDGDLFRQVYWDYENNLPERYNQLSGMQHERRRNAVTDVIIEDVHMRGSSGVAFYIAGSAQRVRLDFVSVVDNDGPGVYLDAESRDNHVIDSCFKNTGREGIAVDGSASNVIESNYFESNDEGGIFLYKNAGERNYRIGEEQRPVHGPRTQHAMGNVIQDNIFYREHKAVWIASRAARNYADSSLFWSDPIIYDRNGYEYRRDFAEGTIVRRNQFLASGIDSLVIEDDNSVIVDNYFELVLLGSSGIFFGSRPRQWINEPVYGTEIRGNRFSAHAPVYLVVHEYCTQGSIITGNLQSSFGGAYAPFTFPAAPCANAGRLHPTLIAATY